MNAIITGFTGYLGKHLTKFLKNLGWNLTGICSQYPSLFCPASEINDCIKEDTPDGSVDYIFHLAAVAKAGNWHEYHKGDVWTQNQKINTNILDYWLKYQPQAKLIAMGTSCSYDSSLSLTEDNYLNGKPEDSLASYAYTKRMLLVGLQSISSQYGLKYNYLIPSTIYGPNFVKNDSHFIFDLIKKIYAGSKGDTVELWGNGEQKRELIYIDDVVKTIYNTLNLDNEILNIGYGKEYSIKSYAKFICNYLKYDFNNIHFNEKKFVGVKSKLLDITRIQYFVPDYISSLIGLSDGLQKTIDYYRST
jgi:GDP-L-fucose synthase